MKYLVLGSSGQIGAPLCDFLQNQGHQILKFDIKDDDKEDLRLYNNNLLKKYIKNCDFVFFLAFDVGGSRYLSQHQHTFEIPHSQLVVDERTIKGSYMGSCVVRNDIPKFINLYKQGKLPVDKLRSGNISLNDLNLGFDKLAAGDAIRQMLVMHDEFSA